MVVSIATDLHTQFELDDVSQSSSWSHKLALTATNCHLQSKLGVLLGGAWCLARWPLYATNSRDVARTTCGVL